MYGPLPCSVVNLTNQFDVLLHAPAFPLAELIVTGAINTNILDQSSVYNLHLRTSMRSLYILPIITQPTRFSPGDLQGDPSLLKNICINIVGDFGEAIQLRFNRPLLHPQHKNEIKFKLRNQSVKNVRHFAYKLVKTRASFTGPNRVCADMDFLQAKSINCSVSAYHSRLYLWAMIELEIRGCPIIMKSTDEKSHYFNY